MTLLNFCPYKEFGVIKSCHEILIIHERNDVFDCPYKEFDIIKSSQTKKVQ